MHYEAEDVMWLLTHRWGLDYFIIYLIMTLIGIYLFII